MEEGRYSYQQVMRSKKMELMCSSYTVPLSLKTEKMVEKKNCTICYKRTKYRLAAVSDCEFYFNNGGGCGSSLMYFCYGCFQKHRQNVFKAKKEGEKNVFYDVENWKAVKEIKEFIK